MSQEWSVVDEILSRYGMTWHLSPYRIVNKHGVIVQSMPHFDLTDRVLAKQAESGFKRAKFEKRSPSTLDKNKTDESI